MPGIKRSAGETLHSAFPADLFLAFSMIRKICQYTNGNEENI